MNPETFTSISKDLQSTFNYEFVQGVDISVSKYQATATVTFVKGETTAYHQLRGTDFTDIVEKIHSFLKGLKSES